MARKRGKTTRELFLKEFPQSLAEETAAIFVGAGVSIGAGYPSWKNLLRDIGEELGVSSDDVSDLAAWRNGTSDGARARRKSGKSSVTRLGPSVPCRTPWTSSLACRFDISGRRTTTGSSSGRFQRWADLSIRSPPSADLALKPRAGAARLYKMHGTVDRLDDVVISTDDYELFRSKRGAFLPLLQAHLFEPLDAVRGFKLY